VVQVGIVIDPYATTTADEFGDMWATLSTIGEFSCRVKPGTDFLRASSVDYTDFGLPHVIDHLQNIGFFVIAAGDNTLGDDQTSKSKLYAFALGYSSTSFQLTTPIYFLLELKMLRDKNEMDSAIEIICTSKCTRREYASCFIEELNLGCILDLL
jgi:hypothetical protein